MVFCQFVRMHRFLPVIFVLVAFPILSCLGMSETERLELRQEAEDMFFHGFNAYMEVAWPADELMPLSCKGRYRGREVGRGDIDDALGNFSLTLVDSLDMLLVLGKLDLFEDAVLKVSETVSFDTDVVVSVFETNIRVVGGLISGHVLSEYLRERYKDRMTWYSGQLLNLALDIGNRLLPAFNSTTGLPYPRVNLKTGIKGMETQQLTCTACAGSIILEFAALSRLSGETIYENVASKAMDYLWSARHRQSNLVGNVLNVNTGDWVRRESGIGAGIDSYYEYVAKAYVLLGEEKYLDRWNTHYSAIMKYLTTGPLLPDVHMHRPTTSSKHFTDALSAFWPGLQVLMGDIKPAIQQHEVLYQIIKKHNFLPEAITSDFQVYWGQHFLRPEFLESTYFLHKATGDPHYLEAGKQVLRALQKYARVTCGYAAVKDVRTMSQEDRMDSFVLTETFKYLYLLFSKDSELFLDISDFVFTTEAHLFPVSLARLANSTSGVNVLSGIESLLDFGRDDDDQDEFAQSCPSTRFLFPGHEEDTVAAVRNIRKPLSNLVESASPKTKPVRRTLLAADFSSSNPEHLKMVKEMGINIISLPDGRTQLLHTLANARSRELGEEGILFMQEMIEIAKQGQTSDSPPKQVVFQSSESKKIVLQAGPAQFGPSLDGDVKVTAKIIAANDIKACLNSQQNGESMWGRIVLVERGDCMFIEKARVIQSMGAVAGVVIDTTTGSAAASSPLFAMSGDGSQDVNIPMVFLFHQEAQTLLKAMAGNPDLEVTLEEKPSTLESDFSDADTEDDIPKKIKSPVHNILTQNMVETQGSPADSSDETPDYISIKTDESTGDVISETIRTVKNKDGTSRTIKTIHRMTQGELEALSGESVSRSDARAASSQPNIQDEEDTVIIHELNDEVNDTADIDQHLPQVDDEDVHEDYNEDLNSEVAEEIFEETYDRVEDIDSDEDSATREDAWSLQEVVTKEIASDPKVLEQLLSIKISDLTMVLEELHHQSKSIKDSFRNLFLQVQELGVDTLIDRLQRTRFERLTGRSDPSEQDLAEMIRKYERGSIVNVLGDTKIAELINEYADVAQLGEEKSEQVKLLTMLELSLDQLYHKMDSQSSSASQP